MTATRGGIDDADPTVRPALRVGEPAIALHTRLVGEAEASPVGVRRLARRVGRAGACAVLTMASALLVLNCRQLAGYGGEVILDPQALDATGEGGKPPLPHVDAALDTFVPIFDETVDAFNPPIDAGAADAPDSTDLGEAAADGPPAEEASPADAAGGAVPDSSATDQDAGVGSDGSVGDAEGGVSADAGDAFTTSDATDARPDGSGSDLPRLVGYWKFDEPTGTPVHDSSGNGNDGVTLPGATFVDSGFPTAQFANPGSLKLDGDGGAVVLGATGLPAANAPKTVSFWVNYPIASTSNQTIVALGTSTFACGLQICLRGGNVAAQNWGGALLVRNNGAPSPGVWHSIIYTFDGTSHGLYVDGANVGITSFNSVQSCATVEGMVGTYPGHWYPYDEYYYGTIDDLRVYSGALNPSQVAFLAAGRDFGGPPSNGGADGGADGAEAAVGDAGDAEASD